MASFKLGLILVIMFFLSIFQDFSASTSNFGGECANLYPQFYQFTCPQANEIVMSVLQEAIAKDSRMAASLLRLHFHDCFVQGCDASILLDGNKEFRSEKDASPNKNSARGFEVVDEIKDKLEHVCPHTVSCADILALVARNAVLLSGGPFWEVSLGRKDSKIADFNRASIDIPGPNSTIQSLINLFNKEGLKEEDLVSLSGGHTIGVARCVSFRQRLYNQNGDNLPDATIERNYYYGLKSICPTKGGDNNISPLDVASPVKFDNTYFKHLLNGKGLLNSDEVLFTGNVQKTMELVKNYAENEGLFFQQFAKSMVKMGNINTLNELKGEIRKNCRIVN